MSRTLRSVSVVLGLLALGAASLSCDEKSRSDPAGLLHRCAMASTCAGGATSLGDICNTLLVYQEGDLATLLGDPMAAAVEDMVACIWAAADCDAMRACVLASASEAQACEGAGPGQRCSGDVLVECDGYPAETPEAWDCAAAGQVCGQTEAGAGCGLEPCTFGTDPDVCDGSVLRRCDEDSGVVQATDCTFYLGYGCTTSGGTWICKTRAGGTCGTDPEDGGLACIGTGAVCDEATFTGRCEGSRMVTCNRGKESGLDCKLMHPDMECALDQQSGSAICQPASQECVMSGNETCQGGVVSFCLLGERRQVDCRAEGFSGCATGVDEDERTVAYCVE
ncbi:MAG TPA: hypothetical protein PK668_17460 [Myxococcota bacterium]|nr:hypothetical protein [Myxococcota bacterium]HRY94949.1 hypothetical protein [Myxococcota bacterium]HSA19988.1 hypothetical protein [Myxococcota bacterium]